MRCCLLLLLTLALLPARAQDAPAASSGPAATAVAVPAAAAPAASSPGPVPPRGDAFQGLAWGATESQIAERFGPRIAPTACDEASRQAAARLGEACDGPRIARYEVAGVPFELRLHLDASDRRLVRVTLTHAAEAPRGSDTRWSERHRLLRRLLAQRYGGAETTDVANEPAALSAYARWRHAGTLIELHSLFVPASGALPAREQTQISYHGTHYGEAGKL